MKFTSSSKVHDAGCGFLRRTKIPSCFITPREKALGTSEPFASTTADSCFGVRWGGSTERHSGIFCGTFTKRLSSQDVASFSAAVLGTTDPGCIFPGANNTSRSCQPGHYLRMTEGYLRMEETSL